MTMVMPAAQAITGRQGARSRISDRYETDLLQGMAGEFYAIAAPGDVREVAKRLGMGKSSWWRRISGVEPTPLSRAGQEALRFRRAGYHVGWMTAYLATIALLPDLEALDARRTHDMLVAVHALEEAANAGLNSYQTRHLTKGDSCFYSMAHAAIDQKEKSCLLAGLAIRLHLLTSR